MVMHRALFTWFILLIFLIILSLRLENRTHWNWFLVFLPMWGFDTILLLDALLNVLILCKRETFKILLKSKNILVICVALLKMAAQIILCLKLEYGESLQLSTYHVLIPFWILFPILIADLSFRLFRNGNYMNTY